MMLNDLYRKRLTQNGSTRQERELNQKRKDFETYMMNSLTKHQFKVYGSNVLQDCTIVDIDRVNRDGDEKSLLCRYNADIKVGDEIHLINDGHWIVVEEEYQTIPSNRYFKIRPCNYKLKWMDNKNIIHERWVKAIDATMYSVGIKYLDAKEVLDGKLQIYISYDNETRELISGKNIFFYKFTYKLTFDSYGGLIQHENESKEYGFLKFTLKQREITTDDNMELGICDYYNREIKPIEPPKEDGINIIGKDVINGMDSCEYYATKILNGIEMPTEWDYYIDFNGNNEKIVKYSISNNKIIIIANSEDITGEIVLKATNKANTNEIITKKIYIDRW